MPALLVLLLAGCFDTTPGRDRDGDGFQNVELGGADCDDDNPLVFPGAGEQCGNGIDDDCDGQIDDDGVGAQTYYVDRDGDGVPGDGALSQCTPPSYAFFDLSDGVDCNDSDASVYEGATEIWYDGIDQACDGGDDYDADGDGYPALAYGGGDCDDTMLDVNPGSVELCNNGVDDDCDGTPNHCEYSGELDISAAATVTLGTSADQHLWGDITGDGIDDLVLVVHPRAAAAQPRILVFEGPVNDDFADPWLTILARDDTSDLGPLVAALGDFNADGTLDIGARYTRNREEGGRETLLFGALSPHGSTVMTEWNYDFERRLAGTHHGTPFSVLHPSDSSDPATLISVGHVQSEETELVGYVPSADDSRDDANLSGSMVRAIVGLPDQLFEGDARRSVGVVAGDYSGMLFGLHGLELSGFGASLQWDNPTSRLHRFGVEWNAAGGRFEGDWYVQSLSDAGDAWLVGPMTWQMVTDPTYFSSPVLRFQQAVGGTSSSLGALAMPMTTTPTGDTLTSGSRPWMCDLNRDGELDLVAQTWLLDVAQPHAVAQLSVRFSAEQDERYFSLEGAWTSADVFADDWDDQGAFVSCSLQREALVVSRYSENRTYVLPFLGY